MSEDKNNSIDSCMLSAASCVVNSALTDINLTEFPSPSSVNSPTYLQIINTGTGDLSPELVPLPQ